MKYIDIAMIVDKNVRTVQTFFARHGMSVRSVDDVRQYLEYAARGKRMESGKRTAVHLAEYRFQRSDEALRKARGLIRDRKLAWDTDPMGLSEGSIVEHVLAFGDWQDVQEVIHLFGKKKVAEIFARQIAAAKVNYRPQTVHFFQRYFHA